MTEIKPDTQALKEKRQEEYLKELNTVFSKEERNKIALRNSGFALFVLKNKQRIKITFSG